MKAFPISNPDDAYVAMDWALTISEGVKTLFGEDSRLMKMVIEADSLKLHNEVTGVLESVKKLEGWLSLVKARQEKTSDETE